MADEAELIRRSAAGELDAFEELVLLKQDRVFRTAYQVVRNAEDARDVAQLVFVRLWRVIRRYRPERKFDTWLYRITVNLAVDYRRHQGRGVEVPLEQAEQTAGNPADSAGSRELRRVYETVAGELTDRQRMIFTLREVDGLQTEEIARSLGVTTSTVRNTLFQARAVLRDALRRRFPEYFVPPRSKDKPRP